MSTSPLRRSDLVQPFYEAETQAHNFRIGAESEKFGFHQATGRPLSYSDEPSVCRILEALAQGFGWEPVRELSGGPVLGLRRGEASITLEPGAQLELSGAPLPDLHAVWQESCDHLEELRPVSDKMGISWLVTGFHPVCSLAELPWVPKQRYPIMREYLPQRGSGGLDMMQRTATTQANFDWSSEEDGMLKLSVALRVSPLLHAWFANSPFRESQADGTLSHRGHVWRHMDPGRSGLVKPVYDAKKPRYEDYVSWALRAGMFLIRRGSTIIKNTGQPFSDFLENGYQGQRATLDDWRLHINTLFPEVRLKNTLEVRSVDGLPPALALASLAVWTGILYDQEALEGVYELVSEVRHDQLEASRPELCDRGLHADLLGKLGFEWAEGICDLARAGLQRRAKAGPGLADETHFLKPAEEILSSRMLPAERQLQRLKEGLSPASAAELRWPDQVPSGRAAAQEP